MTSSELYHVFLVYKTTGHTPPPVIPSPVIPAKGRGFSLAGTPSGVRDWG